MSKFLTEQDLDHVTRQWGWEDLEDPDDAAIARHGFDTLGQTDEPYDKKVARVAYAADVEKPKYTQSYESYGPRGEAWQNYLASTGETSAYPEIESALQKRISNIPVVASGVPGPPWKHYPPLDPGLVGAYRGPSIPGPPADEDYIVVSAEPPPVHNWFSTTSHELGHAMDPEFMAVSPDFIDTPTGDLFARAGEYNKNLIQQTFPGIPDRYTRDAGSDWHVTDKELGADTRSLSTRVYDQYLKGNRDSPYITVEDVQYLRAAGSGHPYDDLFRGIQIYGKDATDEEIADTLNKLVKSTPAADQKSTERIAENKTNYNNSGTKRLRISKNELKQIIQEELDFLLTEGLYDAMKQTYQDARDFVSSPTEFVADRGSAIARDRGIHPEQIVTGVGEDLGGKYLGPYLGPAYETYATYDDFMPRFVRNLVPHTAGEKLLPDEGRHVGEWYAKKIGRDLARTGYEDFVHKHGYDKYGLE